MIYPYRCEACGSFEVSKRMAAANLAEPCPVCGKVIEEQDFSQKGIGGYVDRAGAWSAGKLVPQLGVTHPDRMVTSQTQMEKVYRKHGISLDTGQYKSKEDQIKATVPRKNRLGVDPSTFHVAGVREET